MDNDEKGRERSKKETMLIGLKAEGDLYCTTPNQRISESLYFSLYRTSF